MIGGAGFVGVAACKELMRRGVETIAAGRTPQPYGTFTSFVEVDRTDEQALAVVLLAKEPDVVVDLALTAVEQAGWMAGNFAGRHVVMACAGAGALAVPPAPGRVVLRTGPVIGGGDRSGRLAALIDAVGAGEPVAGGAEPAGIAWVRDLGFALALAADLRRPVEGRTFDIAFEGVSLDRLTGAIGALLGREVVRGAVESPFGEAPALDLAPARDSLGFQPSALEDCLAEVMAHHRASGGQATR